MVHTISHEIHLTLCPYTPLSLPLADTALRSLLTTHSSPLSAKMADNICSLSYKQRPLHYAPQVCSSFFACHTKLDLTDMKKIHLFNPASSFAPKAQQHGSLTQECFGRKPTVHFRFAFGGWRILTRRRTVCWQFGLGKGAEKGMELSARLVHDGACACPTVALL